MAAVRAIALVCLGACVGGVEGGGTGSGSGSGSGASDASIDAPKLMWVDAASGSGSGLPCKQPTTPLTNGHHNTGKSCFDNCHNHGFTLAGTLYTTSTSNTGAAGATVTVVDSTNKTVDIVVSTNGNFYTSQPLSFPVLVMASACPSAVKMNVAVAATGRGCNTCHDPNAGMQMYLQP
jgi:hypothetical protein